MKHYQVKAELLSPLMIQENRQSNASPGLKYLPGSTFRGAVAAHYLRCLGTQDDAAFKKIFLETPVCFSSLLPANDPNRTSWPLPLTARSCKRYDGFGGDKGHGVGDALAYFVAQEIEGGPLKHKICPICKEEMLAYTGFWNGDLAVPARYDPDLVYQRHTGIDRLTGTVALSVFYITQAISEIKDECPQLFCGGLFLDDSQYEILSGWFEESIFVGADRTRGLGEMSITIEAAPQPGFDLQNWSTRFVDKVIKLTSTGVPKGLYFSLGLIDHAIVVDRFLRPSLELPVDFPGLHLVNRVVKQHPIRGWQSSYRLPKPEDIAVAMGSVYLYRYQGDNIKGLEDYLKQQTIKGIGLRRPEGFGRIRLCDPLHLEEVIL